MLKQVFLLNENGIYKDTVLINTDDNTYYDGEKWSELTFNYVEVVPPAAKIVKWDGEKWSVIEEYPKQDSTMPKPSEQEKLNAQLLKQNAELRAALGKQQAFNSQILLELAKLKQGGVA